MEAREQLERLEIDASALLALLRRPLFELTRREMARDARSILEIVS